MQDTYEDEAGFREEVEEEENERRRQAVEAIKPLYDLRKVQREVEARIRELDPRGSGGFDHGSAGVLRRWLLDHEPAPLEDGEHGLLARLRWRKDYVYEAASVIRERDPTLYRRLEELGCLTIDEAQLRRAIAQGWLHSADLEPFRMEVRTAVLLIEEQ